LEPSIAHLASDGLYQAITESAPIDTAAYAWRLERLPRRLAATAGRTALRPKRPTRKPGRLSRAGNWCSARISRA